MITKISKFYESNIIKGGLSDGKSLQDIAKIHSVTLSYLEKQLEIGIKVELEHTSSHSIAKEITMDHLMEDADYYIKLRKVEE